MRWLQLGDKRNKIAGSDLQDIVERFKKRNPEKENNRKAKHFFVPKAEIEANEYDLSISKYKEDVYEEVEYEKPVVIFEKLENIGNEIQKGLAELKDLM